MGKEKNKRGEFRQFSKRSVLTSLAIMLLVVFFFPTVSWLKGYAWLEFYKVLNIITVGIFIIFQGILLGIGIFTSNRSSARIVLGLAILAMFGCVLSGVFFILAWVSVFIIPITLLIVVIFGIVLLMRRRPIYLAEALTLFGIANVFAITLLVTVWYVTLSERLHESKNINGKSYQLISDAGFLDPTVIKLYECNSIGFMCEEIYSYTNGSYDHNRDRFTWEIIDDVQVSITIFVNNEAIYQHLLE